MSGPSADCIAANPVMQAARGGMPGLPTRLAQRTSQRLDLESGQLSKSRTVGMTKIFHDPKSCIFSSYLRCWPDPPGPRSNLIKTIGSLRLVFQSARIW